MVHPNSSVLPIWAIYDTATKSAGYPWAIHGRAQIWRAIHRPSMVEPNPAGYPWAIRSGWAEAGRCLDMELGGGGAAPELHSPALRTSLPLFCLADCWLTAGWLAGSGVEARTHDKTYQITTTQTTQAMLSAPTRPGR